MPEMFRDNIMVDDSIILPPSKEVLAMDHGIAPHGRLFEVVGKKGGRNVLREVACNTVVVGGAVTTLEILTGLAGSNGIWRPETLNDIHNVTATRSGDTKLCLFGLGVGGAGLEFGSVIAPDIKQQDVMTPIGLRHGETLGAGSDANKYYMKEDCGNGKYTWWLKEFSGTPVIKTVWKNSVNSEEDGTEVTGRIHGTADTRPLETFVEISIDLNTNDGREYFEQNVDVSLGGIDHARYNTIGFYTGSKTADDSEYADVRAYSVITFNNKDLTIPNNSSYVYRIYSLV